MQTSDIIQLLPITWQTIAVFVTFFSVLVALFLPLFRDRRRITVKAMLGNLTIQSQTTAKTTVEKLFTTVVNKGRSIVTINFWGLKLKKGSKKKYIVLIPEPPQNLPKMLVPSEQITVYSLEALFSMDKMESIFVCDSLGKYWFCNKKYIKEILGNVKSNDIK